MALPSILLGVRSKMEVVLAMVVVGVEGPLVAMVVVWSLGAGRTGGCSGGRGPCAGSKVPNIIVG